MNGWGAVMIDEFVETDYPPTFDDFKFNAHYLLEDLLVSLKNKAVDAKEIEESLLTLKQLVDYMDFMHNETQGAGIE